MITHKPFPLSFDSDFTLSFSFFGFPFFFVFLVLASFGDLASLFLFTGVDLAGFPPRLVPSGINSSDRNRQPTSFSSSHSISTVSAGRTGIRKTNNVQIDIIITIIIICRENTKLKINVE